jgi:hypothetical protein
MFPSSRLTPDLLVNTPLRIEGKLLGVHVVVRHESPEACRTVALLLSAHGQQYCLFLSNDGECIVIECEKTS